jgi:ribonuclease HI
VVISTPDGEILAEIAEGIGVATNNVAEYRALLAGLARAAELGAARLSVRSDSRLLVEQVAGRFRVKNPTLRVLHQEARDLLRRFGRWDIQHVPREKNRQADRLANEGVDRWLATEGASYRPPQPSPRLWDR